MLEQSKNDNCHQGTREMVVVVVVAVVVVVLTLIGRYLMNAPGTAWPSKRHHQHLLRQMLLILLINPLQLMQHNCHNTPRIIIPPHHHSKHQHHHRTHPSPFPLPSLQLTSTPTASTTEPHMLNCIMLTQWEFIQDADTLSRN